MRATEAGPLVAVGWALVFGAAAATAVTGQSWAGPGPGTALGPSAEAPTAVPAVTSSPRPPAAQRVLPQDHGAVGDGVADDTAALQRALDALRSGDTLVLPAGAVYRHSDVLQVRNAGSRIEGPGALLAADEERSSLQLRADRVRVSGIVLRITGTTKRWHTPDQHRLLLGAHAGLVVSGVEVDGAAGSGIFVQGAQGFRLEQVTVRGTRADGIHMTGGAADGVVDRPVVTGTGDDGVAVVSYRGDAGPTRDITVQSPRVARNTHGRGVSVVGGEDITYRDVRVEDSSAAAVYIATEGAPFFTRSSRRVRVLGVSAVRSNQTAAIDHGAVLLFAGHPGEALEDVLVEGVALQDTRASASFQVGVLAEPGAVLRRVALRSFAVSGGGDALRSTVPPDAYRTSGWSVDGRVVPDQGRG